LREVFDYEYREIAEITGKEEAACRQLLSRARKHIAGRRPRFKPTPEAHHQILNQFIHAAQHGDLDGLLQLLSEDVVLWADSGGKMRGALHRPLRGRVAVARFVLAAPRRAPESYQINVLEVNGAPALVLRAGGEARIVLSIDVDHERICAIHVIGNPDKLKGLNQALHDAGEETT
jgi:RNA polymerase sigma-70 factor (ECF subfamily)